MYKNIIKRLLDILISLLILPFFGVLLLVVAPLIFLEDKGPVFYNAERLGKKGKIFKMFKFRSMYVNSPDIRNEDGTTFNAEKDRRITKTGKIIRKTSIDEVPQILNVLKGDMSLVGPRPDLPDAICLYNVESKLKLDVRPGITGYSQAYYRNSSTLEQRFKGDVFYVNNLSFSLDIKIVAKTIQTVLLKENVYRNEE